MSAKVSVGGTLLSVGKRDDRRAAAECVRLYRGTSLTRKSPLLGLYRRTISRVIWWSWGGVVRARYPCNALCVGWMEERPYTHPLRVMA